MESETALKNDSESIEGCDSIRKWATGYGTIETSPWSLNDNLYFK